MRGMLTEQQCELIEKGLNEAVEPRKVAAYLCLHMGLMLAEELLCAGGILIWPRAL